MTISELTEQICIFTNYLRRLELERLDDTLEIQDSLDDLLVSVSNSHITGLVEP
jgi:hypothetical protein